MKNGNFHVSRLAFVLAVAFCWLGVTAVTHAQTETQHPTRKLGRGVSNIFLCVAEIPRAWKDVKGEHGEVAGLTWGTFRGIKHTAMRFGVGVYEIFTFPYDNGPILYPEFVLSETEEDVWKVKTRDAY